MLESISPIASLAILPIAYLISIAVLLAVAYTGLVMIEIVEQVDEQL